MVKYLFRNWIMLLSSDQQINNTMFALTESMPNGIIIVNNKGQIILCNSELEKMFGYSSGDLLNKSVEQLVPLASREAHCKMRLQYTLSPQKRYLGSGRELKGIRKDSTEFPIEIGLNPIQLKESNFILASVIDISERKKIESRLENAYKDLLEKNKDMEQFLSGISQDLKAPLATSKTFINFIKEDLISNNYNELMDSLNRLEGANKKMQDTVNDLLDFSRIGKIRLNLENINLKKLIEEIIETNIDLIKKINLKIEIPEDCPHILADFNRLTQVFENLISNAIKYGLVGPTPKIKIGWEDNTDELQIYIKDYGPGIKPQHHEQIFALFQRLYSDKEGTGVGLTIVARIISLHNGRVWVVSEVGAGAEFWVALPKQNSSTNIKKTTSLTKKVNTK